jgi:hypothetical protein
MLRALEALRRITVMARLAARSPAVAAFFGITAKETDIDNDYAMLESVLRGDRSV